MSGSFNQKYKVLDRQCVRRSPKVSGGMLKTNYESNACLLLETDLRWLLWRLGLLLRALKSGLWPVMKLTLGRTRGEAGGRGGKEVAEVVTPFKVFLSFFLEDKLSVPEVFSSCSFIPRAHFETSSVMVSCCRY